MSQLKKGALLSYVTIFLTNIVGLALTPFIIRSLGDAEYGLYTLIGAFVGYISVMDLGLNNTIVRFVAKYRAEKDKKGEENFLATTMLIYVGISILVALVGLVLYFNLDRVFGNSLTSGEMDKAKVMFAILIFNLAITLPGGAFTAICSGYEHFVYPRLVNILRYIVRSALVVVLLLYGGDAIGLVVLDTAMNLLVIALNGWYVFRKLKVKFRMHRFEVPLIKEIFSYSVWVFLLGLISAFQWQSGQVLLGIRLDTVSVSIYAVGVMLGSYYGAFSFAISSVFLPRATQMSVNNSPTTELTSMMIKIGRLSFFPLGLILFGFCFFGKEFVFLWVGNVYKNSWTIAVLIMVAYTIPLIETFANSLLEARKKVRIKSCIYFVSLLLGIVIGYFLIDQYKETGMIIGIIIGWVIAQSVLNIYYYKVFGLDILKFLSNVFNFRTFLFILICILTGWFLNFLFSSTGWVYFLFKIICFSIVYAVVCYILVLNKNEKSTFSTFK